MNSSHSSTRPWVLITGASRGIGEAFTRRFAHEGWNIVLVARLIEPLRTLARHLETEEGVKTIVMAADLTEHGASEQVYQEVKRREITLRGLVNNAGCGVDGLFAQAPLPRSLEIIDLNVRALVELTRLFLGDMLSEKQGLIINISSSACFQPLPFNAVYAATKAFVTSFTEALWLETKGTGVRVLNVCPGLTKTDFGIRAGMGDFKSVPFAETPEQVVESTFRALKKTQPTVISGWNNRWRVRIQCRLPHRWLLFLVDLYQRFRKRSSKRESGAKNEV